MRLEEIERENARADAARPCRRPDYQFRPVSAHDPELHELKQEHPYFGYVEAEVRGVRPFVMFSNNDDVVAQVYYWFGADSYESLSLRVWRRLVRASERVVDVGAYTGLFSLVAAFAAPKAEVHALEPDHAARARLIMNLVANRLGRRVHVHDVAGSDTSGTATLHGFQGMLSLTTGSSLEVKVGKDVERSHLVPTARLDELLPPEARRTAVKVDAEEVEDRVLQGMSGLLTAGPVSLLVEVSSRRMLEACRLQLPAHAYAVLDDVRHRAMVEDPSLIDERDENRRRGGGRRRIDPPNVLFHPCSPDDLAEFVAPLEAEMTEGPAGDQSKRASRKGGTSVS